MFRQRNVLFHFSLGHRPRSIRIPEAPALKARFMTEASSSLLPLNEPPQPASQRDNRSLPGKRE